MSEIETGRVDRPVGYRLGRPASRVTGRVGIFDRPVKPVKTPVKLYFLATKRHLSTNRNMHILIFINKTFYKKNNINKPRLLKTLVEWF